MNDFEKGLLRYFKPEDLKKIKNITIGIAGAGGLGSNCAMNLVRCGFSQFIIADFDVLDASNLNRQFYFLDQVGKPKVKALEENLKRINPDIYITKFKKKIKPDNMEELFEPCDIIVEAFDDPHAKKMIVEKYLESGKMIVAASGLAGYGKTDDIRIRRIKENLYLVGDGESEVTKNLSPFSPRVLVAASKQADIILTWVLTGEGYE